MTDSTPFVKQDVQGFLAFLNATEGPRMSALSPAEARQMYVAMGQVGEADPRPLAIIRDLTCPGPAGDIPLRYYDARAKRDDGPVVMFFHGGGFVIGDLDTHHALCTEIAATLDLPVVAVDYRRAPEHPFPAAPDDCEAAARWVVSPDAGDGTFPWKATGIVTTGDSAGGNLAIVVAEALRRNPAAVPVIMQAPLYPATDDTPDHLSFRQFGEGHLLTSDAMDWFMASYASPHGDPRAYPVHGDASDAPPTLLVTAALDPIRDQGRAYARKLIDAGRELHFIEVAGTVHGFLNIRKAVPSAAADTAMVLMAMKEMLAGVSR